MQRVVVFGTTGSGKSRLAEQLSQRTGLRIVELDALYWGRDWQGVPLELFRHRVEREIRDGGWPLIVSRGDRPFATPSFRSATSIESFCSMARPGDCFPRSSNVSASLCARSTGLSASREQSPIWLTRSESRPRTLPSRSGIGCALPVPWVSLTGSLRHPYDVRQTRTRVQKFENRVLPGGVGRFPRGTSCGRGYFR